MRYLLSLPFLMGPLAALAHDGENHAAETSLRALEVAEIIVVAGGILIAVAVILRNRK